MLPLDLGLNSDDFPFFLNLCNSSRSWDILRQSQMIYFLHNWQSWVRKEVSLLCDKANGSSKYFQHKILQVVVSKESFLQCGLAYGFQKSVRVWLECQWFPHPNCWLVGTVVRGEVVQNCSGLSFLRQHMDKGFWAQRWGQNLERWQSGGVGPNLFLSLSRGKLPSWELAVRLKTNTNKDTNTNTNKIPIKEITRFWNLFKIGLHRNMLHINTLQKNILFYAYQRYIFCIWYIDIFIICICICICINIFVKCQMSNAPSWWIIWMASWDVFREYQNLAESKPDGWGRWWWGNSWKMLSPHMDRNFKFFKLLNFWTF